MPSEITEDVNTVWFEAHRVDSLTEALGKIDVETLKETALEADFNARRKAIDSISKGAFEL